MPPGSARSLPRRPPGWCPGCRGASAEPGDAAQPGAGTWKRGGDTGREGDRAAPGEAGGMGWRCDSRRLAAEAALLLPPFPPDLPPRIAALLGGRRAAISIIIAITVFIRGAGVRCRRTSESLLRSRELLPAPLLPPPQAPGSAAPTGPGSPRGPPPPRCPAAPPASCPGLLPGICRRGRHGGGGSEWRGWGCSRWDPRSPGPGPRTAARPRAARGFPEPGEIPAAAAAGAAGGCCNPRQPPKAAVRCGSSPLPGMNPPAVLSRLRSPRLLGCQARVAQFIGASC